MLHLLRQRSFGAMTLSQFLGAFNDNAFKQVVLLLATAIATGGGIEWVEAHAMGGRLDEVFGGFFKDVSPQAVPPFLFALPFVLFGPITGSMADRFSKTTIIRAANLLEIVVMIMASAAFLLEDYGVLLSAVFLMGTQSALFGPSKYGVIKELVGERDLAPANALIQSTTMVAVLFGVFVGGMLSENFSDSLWKAGGFYIAFATIGWMICLRIERLPAIQPERRLHWNPVRELRSHWRAASGNRYLVLSIWASAFFYLMAATFLIVLPTYGKAMGLSDTHASQLSATPGIGIIIGAILAGRISGNRIEGGLVPLGLLGMAASLLATAIAPTSIPFVAGCFVAMGLFSGLFSIPIRCLIQSLPSEDKRGAVQGLAEVMDFIGILLAPVMFSLWDNRLGLEPQQMFIVGGAMLGLFGIVSMILAGEFLVRLVLLALTHTLYRVRVKGLEENLPAEGGALLVANHVSFLDAVLVSAAAGRPVRFLMHRDYFDVPFVGAFARRMGAIPVKGGDSREAKEDALSAAARSCERGDLVCIFAEGAITRTGTMLPFRRGMQRISAEAGTPIIPVALDRVWGSIFSHSKGRFFWKMPLRIPYPVDVIFGEALPPGSPPPVVRDAVSELISDHRSARAGRRGSLAWRFLLHAKQRASAEALVEGSGERMTYRRLLIGSLALRDVLRRTLGDDERTIGVMLPPGRASTLVNVAAALDSRTTVNLNATLTSDVLADCLSRAGGQRLITSKRLLSVLDKESPVPEGTIFVEDLLKELSPTDKRRAALLALLPARLLAAWQAPKVNPRQETATILFSSGSSGDPKGVRLSHAAVLSNVQSVLSVFPLGPGDTLLGVLPHFHSFGYTVGLWSSLLGGARLATHTSPLDAKAIGELCAKEMVTVMIAAPTFYGNWMRRIPAESFASVRFAVAGAEKLRPELATAFEEKYGVALLEGYGATECGPVVSINLPESGKGADRQAGRRAGSVGRPLPGVSLRVVDPDTGELRPPGEDGLVEVKSPALMDGYIGDPSATEKVLAGGWYSTGDVGCVDRDGFLHLTGRLSRFSKIGGEMVPHGRVEECLLAALNDEAELAVTAVPDERKGERLVVVHTELPTAAADLLAQVTAELPPLFLPKASDFIQVESLPRLATGKLDLVGLRQVAEDAG